MATISTTAKIIINGKDADIGDAALDAILNRRVSR